MPAQGFSKKTIKPFYFLYGQVKIKYEDIPVKGVAIMDKLMAFAEKKKIKASGPVVWMYEHIGNGKTVLRAGFPVKDGKVDPGKFKLEKMEPFVCAVAEYKGAMPEIMEAWEKLNIAIEKKGLVPINHTREVYKKWIAFDSKKNITDLQIQIR